MTESAEFYEQGSTGLGTDFLNEVEKAASLICEYPELGKQYSANLNVYVLTRFPYSIVYTAEEEIVIVAVAHNKRRPGYWKNR